jgi:hypothetical protein
MICARVERSACSNYNKMVTMTRNFMTLRNLPSAGFTQRKSRLELGHVLFIEIAGYSKRTTEEESEALPELNRIVGD